MRLYGLEQTLKGGLLQMFSYLFENYGDVFEYTLEHLEISLVSLILSVAIAIPLGLMLTRHKTVSNVVLAVFSILYAIPSLALFTIFLPMTGLGAQTAIIVLVIYAQFILLRNTMTGFKSVDSAVIEAGRGMGYSRAQLFFRIELPLALPSILAGIRIAAVSTIGTATIAATINAGGLGTLLFDGLHTLYPVKIYWGCILSAGLALLVNQVLMHYEKHSLARAKGQPVQRKHPVKTVKAN